MRNLLHCEVRNVLFWCVWRYGTGRCHTWTVGWNVDACINNPDSKVHGATMGPTWVLSAPDGPHDGPMNLAIWECTHINGKINRRSIWSTTNCHTYLNILRPRWSTFHGIHMYFRERQYWFQLKFYWNILPRVLQKSRIGLGNNFVISRKVLDRWTDGHL